MPNNINISDYEKIIFVNNISENNNQKDLITDSNYNFAVFFTNNSDVPNNWPTSVWGSQIRNIWYKGQRLNRFIGIHPNNNAFNISGRLYKLNFNYETGLLGVVYVNKLSSINFVSIEYINAYTNTNTFIQDKNSIGIINSIDNTFELTLSFTVEGDSDSDASKLGSEIDINGIIDNSNYLFTYEYLPEKEVLSQNKLTVTRTYKVRIKYHTEDDPVPSKTYIIKSVYDDECQLDLKMTLRLNPTEIIIKHNGIIVPNTITYNYNESKLDENAYVISFKPNNGDANSYPKYNELRKLYAKVITTNSNIICIDEDNISEKYIPINDESYFQLYIKPQNEVKTIDINIDTVYKDSQGNYQLYSGNSLSKTFEIKVGSAATPVLTIDDSEGNNTLISRYNNTQIDASWSVLSSNFKITPLGSQSIDNCKKIQYSINEQNVSDPIGRYILDGIDSNIYYTGRTITITVTYVPGSYNYITKIYASKLGYVAAVKEVAISKTSETPASVPLKIGTTTYTVRLTNGVGSMTYTFDTVGNLDISTNDQNNTNIGKRVRVQQPIIGVTGVSLSPSTSTIDVNETKTLTATVSPNDASDKSVTWSSSDTSKVKIISYNDTTATIKGIATGNATITVTTNDGSYTASSTITVRQSTVSVIGVSLSPSTSSIYVNGTTTLTATVSPSNASDKSVTWSSSNTNIVEITSSNNTTATIKGKATGSATITVTTSDGNKQGTAALTVLPRQVTNYYWYAGAGPVNVSSTPGSDSNWHLISGTPTSIETGSLSNETRINWVLAVPTSLGLNHISNGALDVTSTFDVTTVTCADGVEYIVFRQAEDTKRINYIFVQ